MFGICSVSTSTILLHSQFCPISNVILLKLFKEEGEDIFAVRNLSFEAKPGDLVAVIGPVGAGKVYKALKVFRRFCINH